MRRCSCEGEKRSHKTANECVHGLGAVREKKDDFRISRDAQCGDQPTSGEIMAHFTRSGEATLRGGVGAATSAAYEAVSGLQVQTEEARHEKTGEAHIGNIRGADDGRIHL